MRKITLVIAIVAVALLLAVFIKTFTGKAVSEDTKEFTIKAFRFGYSPDSIVVNKGDKVIINIDNTDVLHGIRIPELKIKGNDIIEFTANKTGEFRWYCTVMCGKGHSDMSGKLIVR